MHRTLITVVMAVTAATMISGAGLPEQPLLSSPGRIPRRGIPSVSGRAGTARAGR